MQPWNANKASDEDELNHFVQRPTLNVEIHISIISQRNIALYARLEVLVIVVNNTHY